MRAGVALWVATALACTSGSEGFIRAQSQASPPGDDRLVVPGWRAGRVFLGMPVGDLLTALGKPEGTANFEDDTNYWWRGGRFAVWTAHGKVWRIHVGSGLPGDPPPIERLASGLGAGSAEIEIVAAYGPPDSRKPVSHHALQIYCYPQVGIWFILDTGTSTVRSMGLGGKTTIADMCD